LDTKRRKAIQDEEKKRRYFLVYVNQAQMLLDPTKTQARGTLS